MSEGASSSTNEPTPDLDEILLQACVEGLSEYGIVLLDSVGTVLTWNEGAARITGYEESEIVGDTIDVFYTDGERADGVPERQLVAAERNGHTENEGRCIRKDGSRFWANVVIIALQDGSGSVRGFLTIIRDVTERKDRVRSIRRRSTAMEAATDGIAILNEEAEYEYVNEAHADIYGYDDPDDPSCWSTTARRSSETSRARTMPVRTT